MTFYGKIAETPKTQTRQFEVTLESGPAEVRADWVEYGYTHITFYSEVEGGTPKLEWAIRADLVREIAEVEA